jgi:hypothetical protein
VVGLTRDIEIRKSVSQNECHPAIVISATYAATLPFHNQNERVDMKIQLSSLSSCIMAKISRKRDEDSGASR